MGVVVVADRAHRQAARAITERTDHPQQALPEAEQVARHRHLVLGSMVGIDELLEELGDLAKAEFLRLGGAGAFVDAPLQHRIGRAGVQAATARFADAHLLGDTRIRLEFELGENAGQVDARPELGGEDIDFQPERAEPGFHSQVTGGEPAVARPLVGPLGFLRRRHQTRVPRFL